MDADVKVTAEEEAKASTSAPVPLDPEDVDPQEDAIDSELEFDLENVKLDENIDPAVR